MECILRAWEMEDAKDLAITIDNQNVQANLRDGLPYPYSEKDAEEFIHFLLTSDPTVKFAFAITVEERVVGSISVTRQGNIHARTGELGYYIAEDYWGRGIGTSAVKQICHHVFEHTDIVRIFAEPFSYNQGSCRILEKSGFMLEGTLRKNAVKRGEILDMKMYALVKEERVHNGIIGDRCTDAADE